MEAVLNKSTYEIERGKPMPSKNHGIIQSNLSGLFYVNYRKQYRFMSEVAFCVYFVVSASISYYL